MRLLILAFLICLSTISYAQMIKGQVTAGTDTVAKAMVLLVHTGAKATVWPVVDTAYTDTDGRYVFTGHTSDNYLVQVLKPSDDFMHTYFGDVHRWDKATVIKLTTDTLEANINILKSADWNGPGSCSGTITYQNKNKTTGDPVPDVDVVLEQIPGGEAKLAGTTGQNGFYAIGTINSGISYDVSLSIAGVEMDSTYRLTVTSTDTVFPDINLSIDTTTGQALIFPTDLSNVPEEEHPSDIFKIYPNPGNGIFHIQWIRQGTAQQAAIKVFDVNGRLVRSYDNLSSIDLTREPAGVYHVEIDSGSEVIRKQVIVN